jgi:S1-C subfamily serine protease
VLVEKVDLSGPAYAAGIRLGDVIQVLNDLGDLTKPSDLVDQLHEIVREGGTGAKVIRWHHGELHLWPMHIDAQPPLPASHLAYANHDA